MSREEALEKVCEGIALACNMSVDHINGDSEFGKDILADSMKYMAISAMLGTKFANAPEYSAVAGCETVNDVVDWVMANN